MTSNMCSTSAPASIYIFPMITPQMVLVCSVELLSSSYYHHLFIYLKTLGWFWCFFHSYRREKKRINPKTINKPTKPTQQPNLFLGLLLGQASGQIRSSEGNWKSANWFIWTPPGSWAVFFMLLAGFMSTAGCTSSVLSPSVHRTGFHNPSWQLGRGTCWETCTNGWNFFPFEFAALRMCIICTILTGLFTSKLSSHTLFPYPHQSSGWIETS